MANHALDSNPPNAPIDITTHASDWLWAVFSIMTLADLLMIAWSFRRPRGTRAFHHVAIVILTITALDYFAMASDLGSTPVRTEFRGGGARAIWFSRYIDWALTAPLLLLILLLGTGISLSEMFLTLFMAVFAVVSGLIGALVPSTYKWGFFTFALASLFYIWYHVIFPSTAAAAFLGSHVRSGFRMHSIGLMLIWGLYPICWGLSEGGNVITPTSEMVFYGILDLLTKPLFLFAYVRHISSVDYGLFGLQSGKNSQFGSGRTSLGEKERLRTGQTGIGQTAPSGQTGVASTV